MRRRSRLKPFAPHPDLFCKSDQLFDAVRDQVARRAEQEYLSAIEILSLDIKRRQAFISPALLSQLKTVLAEVDRAFGQREPETRAP